MATAWELKQQEYAEQAKKRAGIRSVTGIIPEMLTAQDSGLASFINLIGAVGIAARQYVTGKKQAKEKERLTRKQTANITAIDDVLTEINEVGLILVQEHGLNPTTSEFEKNLYDNLFKTVGYRGNCNITAWLPGTKGENRPVWFKVTQNGRVFEPVNMDGVPPNIGTHWLTVCKNLKDGWANAYQKLLIQQGRAVELEAFQQTRKKGTNILRAVFVTGFAILLFLIIKYGLTIK